MLKKLQDFTVQEEIIRRLTYKTLGGFCDYFERNFELYIEGIRYFDKKNWHLYRWEKRYCLIMLVKLLNTFKSSFELCVTGYFTESIMLTRQVYEAFVRMLFIKKYPEEAEKLFKRFNLTEGAKRLGIEKSSLYHLLSEFSHGYKVDVSFDLVGIQKGELKGIRIGPQYPSETLDRFGPAMNALMFYLWAVLVFMPNALPELAKSHAWEAKYHSQMKDFEEEYIRQYVRKDGKPSSLALEGADEVLKIIKVLPGW